MHNCTPHVRHAVLTSYPRRVCLPSFPVAHARQHKTQHTNEHVVSEPWSKSLEGRLERRTTPKTPLKNCGACLTEVDSAFVRAAKNSAANARSVGRNAVLAAAAVPAATMRSAPKLAPGSASTMVAGVKRRATSRRNMPPDMTRDMHLVNSSRLFHCALAAWAL